MIPLLLSFGLNELSVNSASILRTRKIVSLWKHEEAEQVEQAAMALDTAQEVEAYMVSVRRA